MEISNIRKNIMGTNSFDLKAKGQRGVQDFIVYPISKDSGETITSVPIQSDKRFGYWNPQTGEISLSESKSSHSSSISYTMSRMNGKLTTGILSEGDNSALKTQVFLSANKDAGKTENGVMMTDNSGAINIL
jgi:hypothetical protein